MNSAAVSQNHIASRKEVVKIKNLKRLYDMNSIASSKFLCSSFTNNRIHMNRINCFYIRMLIHNTANCTEHIVHRFTEIFTAMCGDNDQTAIGRPFKFGMRIILTNRRLKRINSGIACYIDAVRVLAFFEQIVFRKFGGRKVVFCHNAYSLTVKFFRIWAVNIICTKTCFNMTDCDLLIETRQRRNKGCTCISMNKNNIRPNFVKDFSNTVKNIGGNIEQCLLVLHNRKVIIRCYIECFKYLVKHLPVLPCNTDNSIEIFS